MTIGTEETGQILSRDAQGRVLIWRERRELLLEEYDRSGMSGVKFAEYIGIKYSTFAYWVQNRRKHRQKALAKAGENAICGKGNGTWVEAVVENASAPRVQGVSLRICFGAGAYCQISNSAQAALAAELVGRLGSAQ